MEERPQQSHPKIGYCKVGGTLYIDLADFCTFVRLQRNIYEENGENQGAAALKAMLKSLHEISENVAKA